MIRSVYVLGVGCHDGYSVLGIFTRKSWALKKAVQLFGQFKEMYGNSDAVLTVNRWTLDTTEKPCTNVFDANTERDREWVKSLTTNSSSDSDG
jgi:hypothetical protein